MDRKIVEYIVFGAIILFQIYFFLKSLRRIRQYESSIPHVRRFAIVPVEFDSEEDVEDFVEDDELNNIKSTNVTRPKDNELLREILESSEDTEGSKKGLTSNPPIVVSLIEVRGYHHPVGKEIVTSINKYLTRNRYSSADFNLIKDIVERNIDVLEDEINLTLSTPLYLGLMGTMFGIILGIISMSNVYTGIIDDKSLSLAISVLLSSVKVAMITSCLGLFLTILNSAVIFKGTKYSVERKKNQFYTFLQVRLVPLLNQGIGATFDSLQRNLSKFNEKFDLNLDRLSGVFDKNHESMLLYKELVQQLDKSNIAEITKYNVNVLKELNVSIKEFHQFNQIFGNLTHYINSTYALADKSTDLLKRTDNFEKIANNIHDNLELNSQFMQFLTMHFANLEKHGEQVQQTASTVSFGIKDAFEVLMRSVATYSELLTEETAIRNIEARKVFEGFSNEMRNALTTQTESFRISMTEQTELFKISMLEKQSKLDHLEILEPLLAEVKAQREALSRKSETGGLNGQLSELTNVMTSSLRYLKRIEKNSKTPFFMKIFSKAKNEEE